MATRYPGTRWYSTLSLPYAGIRLVLGRFVVGQSATCLWEIAKHTIPAGKSRKVKLQNQYKPPVVRSTWPELKLLEAL